MAWSPDQLIGLLGATGIGALLPKMWDTFTQFLKGKPEQRLNVIRNLSSEYEQCRVDLAKYQDLYYDERALRRKYERVLKEHGLLEE